MNKYFTIANGVLGLVSAILCSSAFAQTTVIHAGLLIDGESTEPREAQSIIVEGNRIVGIEDGYVDARGAERFIDLSAGAVMPGLIDTHVHIGSEGSPDSHSDATKNGWSTHRWGLMRLAT